MNIRKHICKGPCGCDQHFNMQCEKDPLLEEKAKIVNEIIKKRMQEIKEEREKGNSNSS